MTGRLIDGVCGGKPRPTRMKTREAERGLARGRTEIGCALVRALRCQSTTPKSSAGTACLALTTHDGKVQVASGSATDVFVVTRSLRNVAAHFQSLHQVNGFTSRVCPSTLSRHRTFGRILCLTPVALRQTFKECYCACAYGPRKHTFKFHSTCWVRPMTGPSPCDPHLQV